MTKALNGYKACGRCKQMLPLTSYWKNSTRSDGLQHHCKDCKRETWKSPSSRTAEKQWEYKISYYFGLTSEAYSNLLNSQDGVCAICKRSETNHYKGKLRRLAIDHDHSDGRVRGLLCSNCNTALGKFEDNIEWLQAAIRYLQI